MKYALPTEALAKVGVMKEQVLNKFNSLLFCAKIIEVIHH